MNGLQQHRQNVVSIEGLWRAKPLEQVVQPTAQLADYTDEGGRVAFADLERKVVDRAIAWQAASVAKPSSPWPKRVAWLAVGTVAWGLACVGVRHVFGSGATLLESVLLILILGTVIGMTILSEL
jgi:hypothetical protein